MFSRDFRQVFLPLVLLSGFLSGCGGNKQTGPVPRYAILSFENLSGDASLDWAARGGREYLTRSLSNGLNGGTVIGSDTLDRTDNTLGGHAAGAPGITSERGSAIAAGANHILTGYLERTPQGVRVAVADENILTHQFARPSAVVSNSVFNALRQIARTLAADAGPPPTANEQAFQLYCTALQSSVASAVPLLERAVELDPVFGRAWIALAQAYVGLGDRARAGDVLTRARSQRLAPVDSARLEMDDAALHGGDRQVTLAALRSIYAASPRDLDAGRALAQAQTSAGDFAAAAVTWKSITGIAPDEVDAWNQLGYTKAWSGDYAGALAALQQYAALRPNEANPPDSRGDVQYWFGKYAEAATSYKAAYAKSAGFLNGGELYKAAWASFLSGDKTAADTLFAKFREERTRAEDPSVTIFYGDWLYRTGREKEAEDLLRQSVKNGADAPPVRAAIGAQLAIWDLLADDRVAAQKDLAAGGASTTAGEALVRFAALNSAQPQEWQARANGILAAPQLAGLRLNALGYALILDGKKQAAIPVWEEAVRKSPGDFLAAEVLARLRGRPIEHRSAPDPLAINVFGCVLDKI